LSNVWKDLKFAARALARRPGSALISLVAFGLGIGITTTMFSIVYAVYFRGLGLPEEERLIILERTDVTQDESRMWVSQHDFYDWQEQQTSFQGLASYRTGTVNLAGTEGPERYNGGFVSGNLFRILGAQPILGRTFLDHEDDPGAPLTVLLGYAAWQDRYDSDPSVVGRVVKANGESATIIGVMPQGFRFPMDQDLWLADRDIRSEMANRHDGYWARVVGRLKDGVAPEQAQLEMATVAQRLAQEYPDANENLAVRFTNFTDSAIGPEIAPIFVAMMIATIFVLLIACANVANLLLARAALRTKEAAVRSAIGASRLRVIFPFFSEAVILSILGGFLGVGLAFAGVALFNNDVQGVGKPYWMDITVDPPILGYVLGVVALTALASGAAPALQISRTDVNGVLKDESRGSSSFQMGRLSRFLVVGQVALSCALLVGAGLMSKSMSQLGNRDLAFAKEGIFTARIGLFETEYPDVEARRDFYQRLVERLEALPSASSVGLTTNLPGSGSGGSRIQVEGEAYPTERDYPSARRALATPGLFATFAVDVLQGRDFTIQDDHEAQPVIIVNQRFVERLFRGEDPLGRRIREGGAESEEPWLTIVGVVPNLEMSGFQPETDEAGYYVPLAQDDARFVSIAVRTRGGDPLSITPEVRQAMSAVDPELPMYWIYDMDEVIRQSTWFYGVFGRLFVVFGVAALFLAAVGLYGVLAFSVSRRFQEMGIRMAMGADSRNILSLILRQGAVQLAIGLTLGLTLAFLSSNVLKLILFEVDPRDPSVFAVIALVIVVVGIVASLVPATRAVRVDPVVAMRYE
jgi:predicted permease